MTQFRPSRKLWQKTIYICIYRFFVGHFDIYIYFFFTSGAAMRGRPSSPSACRKS